LSGRSNNNPFRTYSSEKLEGFGVPKIVNLEEGLSSFAEWYVVEYRKERTKET